MHSVDNALQAEHDRLLAVIMQAPVMMAVLQGEKHVFELVNPLYMQAVGSRRKIIGKPIRQALPELKGQGFYELLDKVYQSGKSFTSNETLVKLDRHGTGKLEQIFVNFICQPSSNKESEVDGILVYATEVTNQVKAMQRLEEQNTVLEMVTSGTPLTEALEFLIRSIEKQSANGVIGSILLLDSDNKHLRANPQPSVNTLSPICLTSAGS